MRKLLLLGLFLGCLSALSAKAQKSLSLVVAGQAHLSQARFDDNALMSARVSMAPGLYSDFLLGVAVGLSPRTAIQATIGYLSYGIDIESQQDYSRQRYMFSNIASFQTDAFEVAVVGRRYFPAAARPNRSWFVEAGADVVLASAGIGTFSFGRYSSIDPNSPGVEGNGYAIGGNPNRLGIRLGVGREWRISPRSALAIGAVASIGLSDVTRYQVVTTWQKGQAIDPLHYTNTIATRVGFVGLQARYRLQLFGLR
jgi:hypothetical protein